MLGVIVPSANSQNSENANEFKPFATENIARGSLLADAGTGNHAEELLRF
jgi:hypothetical protein